MASFSFLLVMVVSFTSGAGELGVGKDRRRITPGGKEKNSPETGVDPNTSVTPLTRIISELLLLLMNVVVS